MDPTAPTAAIDAASSLGVATKLASRFYENFLGLLTQWTSLCLTDAESEQLAASLRRRLPPSMLPTSPRVSTASHHEQQGLNLPMLLTPPLSPSNACGGNHCRSCLINCTRVWLRSFIVGYSVKYSVGTISLLLLSRRPRSAMWLRHFISLLKNEFSRDTLQFALFLAFFLGSYRGLFCLLRMKLKLHRALPLISDSANPTCDPAYLLHARRFEWRVAAFSAGAISSLALFLDRNSSRRTAIALYILSRSFEYGVKFSFGHACRNVLPSNPLPNLVANAAAPALMCLASAQILYSFILAPGTLAPSYYGFLLTQSGYRDIIPKPLLRGHMHKLLVLLTSQFTCTKPDPCSPICQAMHPVRTCLEYFTHVFRDSFKRAIWMYAPLHATFALVFGGRCGRSNSKNNKIATKGNATCASVADIPNGNNDNPPTPPPCCKSKYRNVRRVRSPPERLLRVVVATVRSSLFLAGYVATAWSGTCLLRWAADGRENISSYALNGIMSGLWCLLEPASRRLELAMYCLPRALEAFWRCMLRARFLPSSENVTMSSWPVRTAAAVLSTKRFGEPLYFALAVGTLTVLYETEPHVISPTFMRVLARFFGANQTLL